MKAKNIISIFFLITIFLQTSCDDNDFSLATSITLSEQKMEIEPGDSKTLTATTPGSDAPTLYWMSSNPSIASVDQNGKVTAVAVGTCVIICRVMNSFDVKAECQVKVVTTLHEYVDLGLPSGTLWATCNIGASKPEDYGDYFAWGETTAKSYFDWSNYKYCNGSETNLTKYNRNSSEGFVDNKLELDSEDDAATANWGKKWKMPSIALFDELINSNYTTTTWTTQNSVYGLKVMSKSNTYSIFLPAAGQIFLESPVGGAPSGQYWSCSLNPDNLSNLPYELFFESGKIGIYGCARSNGRSVRPVRMK